MVERQLLLLLAIQTVSSVNKNPGSAQEFPGGGEEEKSSSSSLRCYRMEAGADSER